MNAQETIKQLLRLRLTKFQLGFVLGLEGHEPNANQKRILEKIQNHHQQIGNNNAAPSGR